MIINKAGKLRFVQHYTPHNLDIERVKNTVLNNEDAIGGISYKNDSYIYFRKFASLFFIMITECEDILLVDDGIQQIVDCLDLYFKDVCELDLVENFHKLYCVVDEIIVGGYFIEPNNEKIILRVREIDSKSESQVKKGWFY
eukprot:Mrub_13766.p2 GENE.Mrub_13766~~Mrub_13766.p2  ORF type:complete len:151 (+),score=23.84 Mrub_13766:29-454(+)